MKRAVRFKLKRFNTSRMLFSLAVCSFALVGFSAIAYSLAIPSVLMDVQDIPASIAERFGAASVNREGASEDADGAGTAVSGGEGTASTEPGTVTAAGIAPGLLPDAPAFSFNSPDGGGSDS